MQRVNADNKNWLKVLGKGMITLPKIWREELGIKEGEVVLARKEKSKIIIEPLREREIPYRVYSQKELEQFLKDDELSSELSKKIKAKLKKLMKK